MKCVNCKKPIESDAPHMVIPNREQCGYRARRPTIFWCEPCWSENVRFNDRTRAEAQARLEADIAEARKRLVNA